MEIEDCAFPALRELRITSDPSEAFDGCEVALMVGSKPRGPGMERSDLLKENGVIWPELHALTPPIVPRTQPFHLTVLWSCDQNG